MIHAIATIDGKQVVVGSSTWYDLQKQCESISSDARWDLVGGDHEILRADTDNHWIDRSDH